MQELDDDTDEERDEVAALPLVGPCFAEVDEKYPKLDLRRRRNEALRRFFGVMVEDVLRVTRDNLSDLNPQSAQDIRMAGRPMAQFSSDLWVDLKQVRTFLFTRMYRAPSVVKMRIEVTEAVTTLFPLFMQHPELLPKQWRKDVQKAKDDVALARIVVDYIAGMTDRFALQEYERLAHRKTH